MHTSSLCTQVRATTQLKGPIHQEIVNLEQNNNIELNPPTVSSGLKQIRVA